MPTLESVAEALAKLDSGTLDTAIRAGLDRGMVYAQGLAARDAMARGNGTDELGRPRRKPGARRMWQTIRPIKARRAGSDTWTAGLEAGSADVKHARIQELGGQTRPHVIVPKRARFLVFYWPRVSAVVYFRKVNHPGSRIPARPYLRPAIERAKSVVQQEVTREVVKAINDALR